MISSVNHVIAATAATCWTDIPIIRTLLAIPAVNNATAMSIEASVQVNTMSELLTFIIPARELSHSISSHLGKFLWT